MANREPRPGLRVPTGRHEGLDGRRDPMPDKPTRPVYRLASAEDIFAELRADPALRLAFVRDLLRDPDFEDVADAWVEVEPGTRWSRCDAERQPVASAVRVGSRWQARMDRSDTELDAEDRDLDTVLDAIDEHLQAETSWTLVAPRVPRATVAPTWTGAPIVARGLRRERDYVEDDDDGELD